MCLQDDDHVQLQQCHHGSFHLRVANTTLHLSKQQVIALHRELNRCIRSYGPDANSSHNSGRGRFGPFLN